MEPSPDFENVKRRMAQMVAKLREHDFRITPQRLAIMRILAASEGHPSVEMVYETVRREFPTTSIATIYKTVNLLKQINEVLELGFPDGSNRYDGNRPFPHPHVICTKCREIMDPELASMDEVSEEINSKTRYKLLYYRLDFFGLCPRCQEKGDG
jgi:Fur family peroxide stress response transcriptional regulator